MTTAIESHPTTDATATAGAARGGIAAADAFDFLTGDWHVRHRKLGRRLAGSTTWLSFEGTCSARPLLGGLGNVDDNVLEDPTGPYRAASLRCYDRAAQCWSIWWLDARAVVVDSPVRGGFVDGVGTFFGDDVFEGRPIVVRFRWSGIGARSARWEQAFSADGGQTWEINWVMDFERVS